MKRRHLLKAGSLVLSLPTQMLLTWSRSIQMLFLLVMSRQKPRERPRVKTANRRAYSGVMFL